MKLNCMEDALFKHNVAYSFAQELFFNASFVCVCVRGGGVNAPMIIFDDSLRTKFGP